VTEPRQMLLSREEVVAGLPAERAEFVLMLRGLWEEDGGRPTRCEGWSIRAVASHVLGELVAIVAGNLVGQGTPEMTRRHVTERDAKLLTELADELEEAGEAADVLLDAFDDAAWATPAPAGVPGTLGAAVEALWYDTYMHHEDILAALHQRLKRGPGLHAALDQVALRLEVRDWGPATLVLDGFEDIPINGGGGRRVIGEALEFVLVATGRADPAPLGLDSSVNVYS
jgi:uncharacterized protein (TIGR03083 family)